MSTSQNGWPLVDSTKLDNSPIPGTSIKAEPGLLKGDVAWLLRWVGSEFNKRVDPLVTPGCWGWNAPTPIPGSNIYSNHCSGTAIDLNAPHFPWTLKTMSARQREECRKIVNQTEGVVAWGGDFTTKTDEMHFEINGTSQYVARIVNKLKGVNMKPEEARSLGTEMYQTIFHRAPESPATAQAWGSKFRDAKGNFTPESVAALLKDLRTFQEWKNNDQKMKFVGTQGMISKAAVLDYLNKSLK
jgi:hypothetical protein